MQNLIELYSTKEIDEAVLSNADPASKHDQLLKILEEKRDLHGKGSRELIDKFKEYIKLCLIEDDKYWNSSVSPFIIKSFSKLIY